MKEKLKVFTENLIGGTKLRLTVLAMELMAVMLAAGVFIFLMTLTDQKIVYNNLSQIVSSELQSIPSNSDEQQETEDTIIKEICVDEQEDENIGKEESKTQTNKYNNKPNIKNNNQTATKSTASEVEVITNESNNGPVNIDTSQWRFDKIDVEYDGKEHIAEVSGLPDWVTPVYRDNKRTDVGTNKAYVSFIVPEGYNQPADMETDIIIRKGKYKLALSENDIQMLGNGEFRIAIAEDRIPEGVEVKYLVNGSEVSKDYVLSGSGQYIVTAKFTHSNPNYEPIEDSEVLYVKKDEITKNQPYELILKQAASEKENEINLEIYLNCIHSSPQGFQAYMRYDSHLEYQGMEWNSDQWSYGVFREDTGYIYFSPDFARDMSFVGTIKFSISEEEKIGKVSFSDIMVLDRGWGQHNIDPVEGVVSKIPQYEVASLNTILSDVEIESCSYGVNQIQAEAEAADAKKEQIEESDELESEAEEIDVIGEQQKEASETESEAEEIDVIEKQQEQASEPESETEETDVIEEEDKKKETEDSEVEAE